MKKMIKPQRGYAYVNEDGVIQVSSVAKDRESAEIAAFDSDGPSRGTIRRVLVSIITQKKQKKK